MLALCQKFGAGRVWRKAMEMYGFPVTWELGTPKTAELMEALERQA